MKWEIAINEEEHYAEIVTYGIADKKSTLEMVKGIADISSRQKVSKILLDHRNIESVSGTVTEIYNRPKEFAEAGVIKPIKIAEIIKKDHEEHFKILKLILLNRGINISVFYDKDSALKWLDEKTG